MTKVSVVVPTYRPGDGLQRVVDSLDAQTMPTDDFEVVFVDDGSPDDTHERLLAIAAERPHVVVEQIEGSGWASRPRNVGLSLARGEYTLFMDHDDALFPDALERAHALGSPAGADVINPKEVRTRGWNWGLDVWQRDRIVTGDDLHVKLMMPMTPHKLYRTEFLREHGIAFREGARILWEDIYFNTEVYARLSTLALYSSAPFYRWVIGTGANNSATFTRSGDEWWDNIERVVDFVGSGILTGDDEHWLMSHQMNGRILSIFSHTLEKRGEEFTEVSRRRAIPLVERAVASTIDAGLAPIAAARAHLLRAGRFDDLRDLARLDAGVGTAPVVDDLAWEGRDLLVRTRTSWRRQGLPLPFRLADDRLLRDLPDVGERLPADLVDVTDAVDDASARISVRDRETHAGWIVPTTSSGRVVEQDGTTTVAIDSEVRVPFDGGDVTPALGGRTWDVSVRSAFLGFSDQRELAYDGPPRPALLDGRVVVAYSDKHGHLAIDTDERVRRFLAATNAVPRRTHVTRAGGGGLRLVLPLKQVHVVGAGTLDCEVLLRPEGAPDDGSRDVVVPASVVADEQTGARVVATLRPRRGRYRVLLRRGDRERATPVRLRIGLFGRTRVGERARRRALG